ncbi:Ribosomal L18p/L5e family protein isoform 1 [Tripterygium wilfordii]|uniref:Ribosomal L18p/L5e family protein isoform 1 n=1 Tax=Tripterygium wilfordii TaxID=458696 RepID=A0A7J7E0E0_TRIWF|nr:50S ribosomal protein L18 [Tripterygium wilfordii]KAF5752075.1 Ribosomal L18p/L5e family protein isoform 1 [Tripterygium wilfordii]
MLRTLDCTALTSIPPQFYMPDIFGAQLRPLKLPLLQRQITLVKPLVVEAKAKARANTRKESAKTRNRRIRKKYDGTPAKPRLSVFCSAKQLYATLVDDERKRCIFSGSTSQESIRGDPPCTTIEAARRLGEEVVMTCEELDINEISSYDRNGFARGERMQAFEIAISAYGFLAR